VVHVVAQHQPSVCTAYLEVMTSVVACFWDALLTLPTPLTEPALHWQVLQLAVLSFCFGFGVVYLVIIRDILLGTPPDCNGLLCEVLGLSPSSIFYDARVVILLVAVLVCCPLLLLRLVLLAGLLLGIVRAC